MLSRSGSFRPIVRGSFFSPSKQTRGIKITRAALGSGGQDGIEEGGSGGARPRHWLVDKSKVYFELSKFRLSSLVVLTTGAGFLAAGAPVDVSTMTAACLGTALCAGSASAFNHVIEMDYDALMSRTKKRPLPSGMVSVGEATGFGVGMGVAGTGLLLAATNPVVTALGAANIALYAGAYTWSKRHSELNTWLGSLVGAIPPVMGWAAATGGVIATAEPLALGSLLFLWQFPHFFSLSWLHREDYSRGGFEMVAVNDPSGSRSAGLIMEYSVYLTALPVLCSATGLTGSMFAVEGVAANAYLLYLANRFRSDRSNANARRIFLCSLWYLPLLMTGFVLHNRNWQKNKIELDLELITAAAGVAPEASSSEEAGDIIEQDLVSGALRSAKDTLRGLCVHEHLATPNSNSSNSSSGAAPHLCAKVGLDNALVRGSEAVEQGREAASAAAAAAATANVSKGTK